jgi:hypothetical protein
MKPWVKMQSWSSEDSKDIKHWLNLDNYLEFGEITLERLYHELWARTYFFKIDIQIEEGMKKVAFNNFIQVTEGDPFLIGDNDLKYMSMDDQLYQPPYFLLTTTDRIANISIACMKSAYFISRNLESYRIASNVENAYISEIMPEKFPSTVMVEIDLAAGTDDEIVESLRFALPQWRKIKGIQPASLNVGRFGLGTIKKIINYRLIPMIDIIAWATHRKVLVSDDRLSRLLYSDEDDDKTIRQGYHIRDADRPLAMKATTIDFIRQFNLFLNKNPHLRNLRVSEVMKLSDSD